MNRFVLYFLLTLLYLSLAKSLSPGEYGVSYINSKEALKSVIPGAPLSAILVDRHATGFIIKTYYHKYRIVYGFQTYDEIVVRTSQSLDTEFEPYLGMSIFRRYKDEAKESFIPLPPGSVFVGDKSFGAWKKNKSGEKVWKFFRTYRQIPNYLKWDTFKPTHAIYQTIQEAEKSECFRYQRFQKNN